MSIRKSSTEASKGLSEEWSYLQLIQNPSKFNYVATLTNRLRQILAYLQRKCIWNTFIIKNLRKKCFIFKSKVYLHMLTTYITATGIYICNILCMLVVGDDAGTPADSSPHNLCIAYCSYIVCWIAYFWADLWTDWWRNSVRRKYDWNNAVLRKQ